MNVVPGSSGLILFVDDYADSREMYRDYLSFVGYRVELAASGQEGIRLATLNTPNLILMDIGLPDMSGGEALHRLRAVPQLADVPVVAFTAHALEHEMAAHLVAGFDAVITKPCLPPDLVTLIEPILAKRRQAT